MRLLSRGSSKKGKKMWPAKERPAASIKEGVFPKGRRVSHLKKKPVTLRTKDRQGSGLTHGRRGREKRGKVIFWGGELSSRREERNGELSQKGVYDQKKGGTFRQKKEETKLQTLEKGGTGAASLRGGKKGKGGS